MAEWRRRAAAEDHTAVHGGMSQPYYISLSRVESEPVAGHPCLDSDTVSHVSHQFSRLWWVSMAVYLKVVSVRVHTESSVLNKLDERHTI